MQYKQQLMIKDISLAAKAPKLAEPRSESLSVFSLLIIFGWGPYNNIWMGVEFSPLSILLQIEKSKMAAIQISIKHNFVNIHNIQLAIY